MGQGEGGGPKTARGKAVSRRNSEKHALTSSAPVIPLVESEGEWRRFRKAIVDDLGPKGAVEAEFAEQAALLFWRLRRVTRFEHESLLGNPNSLADDLGLMAKRYDAGWTPRLEERFKEMVCRWARRLVPDESTLERVVRYETHLRRQLRAVLRELWLAQMAHREGKGGRWLELKGADANGE